MSNKKTYIDSDGVLADFVGWVRKIKPELVDDDGIISGENKDALHRLMYERREDFYLLFDKLPGTECLFYRLKNDENCFVLTAGLPEEAFYDFCSSEEAAKTVKLHYANKLKWFEKHGVPAEKVIITGSRDKKMEYAAPDAVLYDDNAKTLKEWREKGGTAYQIKNHSCSNGTVKKQIYDADGNLMATCILSYRSFRK